MQKPNQLLPREKLKSYGSQALSTPDLIALILGTGTRKEHVTVLAKRIVRSFDSLQTLSETSQKDLTKIKGIGMVNAGKLIAAFELGRRLYFKSNNNHLLTPQDVIKEVNGICNKTREHLIALYVDARHQLLKKHTVSIGSLNQMIIEPRDVYTEALKLPCAGIILVHNHPSNDPTPSEDDIVFTKKIIKAGELLGIQVIDHLVVTKGEYRSMKEEKVI